MQLPFASRPILPAEKEPNFSDLAHILDPLRDPPASGAHVLWAEVLRKTLEIVRFLRHMLLLFKRHSASPPQARGPLLTNLKSYLIIRISKGQAADGKPETNGGDNEDWLCARLQT